MTLLETQRNNLNEARKELRWRQSRIVEIENTIAALEAHVEKLEKEEHFSTVGSGIADGRNQSETAAKSRRVMGSITPPCSI